MRFALRFNRIRPANCIVEGSVKRLSRHKAARRRGASLFIPRPLDFGKEMGTRDDFMFLPLDKCGWSRDNREELALAPIGAIFLYNNTIM